ncbi:hypothetical protein JZY91_06345 [Corynebacterium sp. CNCTC7651]|uniref:hypothetical protein n=1 Tax=Corynebacterium sp. CNCTC7651 TaxID=2815361 RepID=UPI001F23D199|nr:hypothetical protein [Corynebacterium sp. CNCTC7651]UIZ91389.1 hypothetical protein JZY91_06345 [Corynebacterium sp. CNCTC7651]
MTIAIRPVTRTTVGNGAAGTTSTAAEVWDIPAAQHCTGAGVAVRQLGATTRTHERGAGRGQVSSAPRGSAFESARERRDNIMLGALFTAALLVGSAFGGVFSSAEAPIAGSQGGTAASSATEFASAQAR